MITHWSQPHTFVLRISRRKDPSSCEQLTSMLMLNTRKPEHLHCCLKVTHNGSHAADKVQKHCDHKVVVSDAL